ncbi:predicted protein [Pyrenophora tritici-repentis Pt-1C-BFP]|uniref:Uncharacterized protein n=1 Tax=Pyrenophora tritici-repentis (strain Pt-1C-BFP) TaxID=426418 RepID=B2WIH4_PYRTR|nr:uncharacterized protein PTRG_09783 [Pyrenophora tritici-repentis Pt-1C-BFP]EDU42834.1 predicted protein [Pyrenophora tritici-repentis Pt-1C-BFP]
MQKPTKQTTPKPNGHSTLVAVLKSNHGRSSILIDGRSSRWLQLIMPAYPRRGLGPDGADRSRYITQRIHFSFP